MSDRPAVVWFRNDLRLADHRALTAAVKSAAPLIFVYILDDTTPGNWKLGAASRWWLHRSLQALGREIKSRGGTLTLRRGPVARELPRLVAETNAATVYFTRGYDPAAVKDEEFLKSEFDKAGVAFKRYGGTLLREPEEMRTKSGDVFKVYTPFARALLLNFTAPKPLTAPARFAALERPPPSDDLASWSLHPGKPDWSGGLNENWQPGEAGARDKLAKFTAMALRSYASDRNRPDIEGTSRLSPHLHFGEISTGQCWAGAVHAAEAMHGSAHQGLETFIRELIWREFSHTLLLYWPDLPERPFRSAFAAFPWRSDNALLKAWQRGETGYPIVDAGMRELWHSGYMHNRVRMITASFLVKHLLLPWQDGEAWFWNTLVDADLANNAASWQWVAGSGADAAPYFRIFNPVTQGEKFDPDGIYVKRWLPELRAVPPDAIHTPWLAPDSVLAASGVTLGRTYPRPVVDHAAARARALDAYAAVKADSKK